METVEKRVSLALVGIGAVILLIVWLAYREGSATVNAVTWVSHTHEVMAELEGVIADMASIRLDAVHFISTGDQRDMPVYHSSRAQIRRRLSGLRQLTSDNLPQKNRMILLEQAISKRLILQESAISIKGQAGPEAAIRFLWNDTAIGAIDVMRIIARMEAGEKILLLQREADFDSSRRKATITLGVMGAVVLLLLVFLSYILERDIRVRKWAHKALHQSEKEFRDLYDKAPCGYFSLDPLGFLEQVNVTLTTWLGYSREEVLQVSKSRHFLTPESTERFEAVFARFKEGGRIDELGLGMVRKDNSVMPVLLTAEAIRDSSDRYISCRGTIFDITERKKAEDHLLKTVGELKRSNDELQQFAYVASHDLQEPLRMVASYTQLIAKRYKGRLDSDADEFIAYAVDGSNRMQSLIQDLLAYSRAGANGKAFRKTSSESALQQAITNLGATIKESGAVITHDSLPAITTNDGQLTQVFQNLLGNAIKYRRTEVPRVHVSATKNGGNEWIFSVRDNGMGIDPLYFEKIFVLFQRLHGRERFAGTGIGLAICKKILERLGGRIWVESQPDEGSSFYFALPESELN